MGPAMGLLLRSLLLLAPVGWHEDGPVRGQGLSPPQIYRGQIDLKHFTSLKPNSTVRLSYSQVLLEGLVGESVYFPALRPVARDIVRIIWFSGRQGTHIAEAKPQAQEFNTNYLPYFSNRLAIHTGNLSLEMRELRLEDTGPYRAVVDISSDPTNPRTFSYELSVRGRHQEGRTTGSPGGGERRTTTGPPGGGERRTTTGPPGGGERRTTTGPPGGGEWRTTMGPTGGGEWRTTTGPPGRGGDPMMTGGSGGRTTVAGGNRGVQDGEGSRGSASCHCALMGYLTVAVYVPLSIVVAIVHVKTRS